MSLRFIPDSAKTSPLKMFLKYAEDKEKKELKKKRKKLLSFEYFLYMRGLLDEIFGFQGMFLKSILNEYNIEERKPKKILKDILSSFENKYFNEGKFNREIFDKDYNNYLSQFSKSFNTVKEEEIAQNIVVKNEYKDSNSFENEKVFTNVEEFKSSLEDRQKEMAFLMMYLAKIKENNYNTFLKTNEGSQIVNDIASRELFTKIRSEYQNDIVNKLKKENIKIKAH